MDQKTLHLLEKVNQLSLSEAEKEAYMAFAAKRDNEMDVLNAIDTADVERMVHVMPILTVVREDVACQPFTRDELQKGAPETMDGYWQVPRVVE